MGECPADAVPDSLHVTFRCDWLTLLMTLFPLSAKDLLGAEGQHGSVAAGNSFMLRGFSLKTQVQIPLNFAQRYQTRYSLSQPTPHFGDCFPAFSFTL